MKFLSQNSDFKHIYVTFQGNYDSIQNFLVWYVIKGDNVEKMK